MEMASTVPEPPGGPVPPRVGARPLWACLSGLALGGQTPLPPGRGPAPPRAASSCPGGGCGANPATCPWQKTLRGTPAQLPHLLRVGGLCLPKTGHGLPTNTLGRYADTTVSPPVSKAAQRITAHCAQASSVQSTHCAARVNKG
jgi:hypothetical protein